MVIGKRDDRFEGGRGARGGDVLAIIEDRAIGRHKTGFEPFGRIAEGNQAIGNLFGERTGLRALACHVDWYVDRAKGLGATPMQVTLAWQLQRTPNVPLIPGTSSIGPSRENPAAAELALPDDAIAVLDCGGEGAT